MRFSIKNQDLLSIEGKYVICHCISSDCGMGRGVVVPIKKKYIGVKEACIEFVKSLGGDTPLGCAFRYNCEAGIVYNLFTKVNYHHKVGFGITEEQYYKNLTCCLNDMKNQMLAHSEKFLAMPKIACGLDKCQWEGVEQIIKSVFEGTDVEILVCVI